MVNGFMLWKQAFDHDDFALILRCDVDAKRVDLHFQRVQAKTAMKRGGFPRPS
jgi:hypothetical protein